jgi:hypothetical protein
MERGHGQTKIILKTNDFSTHHVATVKIVRYIPNKRP